MLVVSCADGLCLGRGCVYTSAPVGVLWVSASADSVLLPTSTPLYDSWLHPTVWLTSAGHAACCCCCCVAAAVMTTVPVYVVPLLQLCTLLPWLTLVPQAALPV